MPCFLRENPPRRWPWQSNFHLSLSKHSPCLFTYMSHRYSSIISFYLLSSNSLLFGFTIYSFSHIHFVHKLILHPLHMSVYFFLLIPPLHTSLQLHKFTCHIFHILFHCSHHPILSLQMSLSCNSSP